MLPLLFGTFNDNSLTTPIFAMHLTVFSLFSVAILIVTTEAKKVEFVEYFAHWEIGNSEGHIWARQHYYVIWQT